MSSLRLDSVSAIFKLVLRRQFFHPISESASDSGKDTKTIKRSRIQEEPHEVTKDEDQSTIAPDKNSEQVLCPICNTEFKDLDNRLINEHIDGCLNMSLVRNEMKASGTAAYESGSVSHDPLSIRTRRKDNQTQSVSSKSLRDYFGTGNHA